MSVAPEEGQDTPRVNTHVGAYVPTVRLLMIGTFPVLTFPEVCTVNVQDPPVTAWGSLSAHHRPSHGLWGLQYLH